MPPQGESTGVAIEDGVLLAHALSRRDTRSVAQMIADYECIRKDTIKKLYDETTFRWNDAGSKSWLKSVIMDWMTWAYIFWMNYGSKDHFARDVRTLELPL
jgi:2-polyprenyl-6-methoxyphenol hydroxylase-like FAD-dependent oxidoreductase